MPADAGAVQTWMREHTSSMVRMLKELVEIETPSTNPSTHEPALTILEVALRQAGLRTERWARGGAAQHLHAAPPNLPPGATTQLLLGHIDTVWDEGTLETMPLELTGDRLAGPGCFDMKAGLVQMVHALLCVSELGIELPAAPVVFITGDEELGSPHSTPMIKELASTASRAFVLEPAFGPRGDLKTARKGVGRFRLKVRGRAAHSGLDPDAGASAVLEIAQQIQRIFELNDRDRGINLNVGTVIGGLRPNVVAPEATAEIDCRVPTHDTAVETEKALRSLQPVRDGVRVEIEGKFRRSPMEPTRRNRALWNTASRAAEELGLDISEASVGGGSDGNTASEFTATLDGLGAVGGGAHASDEHIFLSKLPERAALLALLLAAPPEVANHRQDAVGQNKDSEDQDRKGVQ